MFRSTSSTGRSKTNDTTSIKMNHSSNQNHTHNDNSSSMNQQNSNDRIHHDQQQQHHQRYEDDSYQDQQQHQKQEDEGVNDDNNNNNDNDYDDDDDDDMIVIERELRRPYEVQTPTKYRQPLRTTPSSNTTITTTTITNNPTRTMIATSFESNSNEEKKQSTPPVIVDTGTGVTTTTATTTTISTSTNAAETTRIKTTPSQTLPSNSSSVSIFNSSNNNDTAFTATAAVSSKKIIQSTATTTTNSTSHHHHSRRRSRTTIQDRREFQRPIELPHVTVRYVNVQQRSAFDQYHTLSQTMIQNIILHQQQQQKQMKNATTTTATTNNNGNNISPSIQLLQIYNRIYHHPKFIRQIQFSPSSSIDADYHYYYNNNNNNNNNTNTKTSDSKECNPDNPNIPIRDGRYRSIDPTRVENIFRNYTVVAAAAAATTISAGEKTTESTTTTASSTKEATVLPPTPKLSHEKYRLPFRVDVGFSTTVMNSNSSSSDNNYSNEIQIKQMEIRNETMWEEVQVRIACATSSFNMMIDDDCENDNTGSDISAITSTFGIIEKHIFPYAGRHLRSVLMSSRRRRQQQKRNNDFISSHLQDQESSEDDDSRDSFLQPNPYSMLAPPYESIYSPSQGWRPRLFHDRPTGLRYIYVCPISIQLWEQDDLNRLHSRGTKNVAEPHKTLIGGLTLYTLPPLSKRLLSNVGRSSTSELPTAAAAALYHCTTKQNNCPVAYGKISEEYCFPIQTFPNSSSNTATESDRSAIFSYNLHDLVMESMKSAIDNHSAHTEPDSLYIVLRVYEATAVNHSSTKDQVPGQIMNHVAIGVTKVFTGTQPPQQRKVMLWPDGQVKTLQLYSYRNIHESQTSFVERLWRIVHQKSLHDSQTPSLNGPIVNNGSEISDDKSSKSGQSNNSSIRFFRASNRSRTPPPVQNKKTHNRSFSVNSFDSLSIRDQVDVTRMCINGSVKLHLSSLHMDFLLCLLSPPLHNTNTEGTLIPAPKQITDVTGDFSITINSDTSDGDGCDEGAAIALPNRIYNKRSNLTRLPQHVEKAGYSQSPGCQEMIYLPARPDRQYYLDDHTSLSRSILNLLYIYPRLIRSTNRRGQTRDAIDIPNHYTIRIQVLSMDKNGSRVAPSPIQCFFNRSKCGGASLHTLVYTNIVSSTGSQDMEVGVATDDEIRVHLPDILDGQFKIEFALYSIELIDHMYNMEAFIPIATATIPLTSTRSQDSVPGIRVATVIPNGKHRLELGNYQLLFETRLISSIHTSDTFVAATIRNFPVEDAQLLGIDDAETLINRTGSTSSIPSMSDIAAQLSRNMISTCAIASFFQVILYVQLHNIIFTNTISTREFEENFTNFLLVLTKVKSFLSLRTTSPSSTQSVFGRFMRSYLDLFDEFCLFEANSASTVVETDEDVREAAEPIISELHEAGDDGFEVGFVQTDFESSSSLRKNKLQRRLSRRLRISQEEDKLGNSSTPFSRVAFAANKLDQMRITPVPTSERSNGAPFYDDDETIATIPSLYSTRNSTDNQTMTSSSPQNRQADASIAMLHSFDDNNSVRPVTSASQHSLDGAEFVKRVRTVAAIILAPCVAPSLSSVLRSPQHATGALNNSTSRQNQNTEANVFARTARCLCSPGSDIDEDCNEGRGEDSFLKQRQEPRAKRSIRERLLNNTQQTSISTTATTNGDKRSTFLYESLIKTILQTCSDQDGWNYQQSNPNRQSDGVANDGTDTVHNFFRHIDFILPLCLKSIVLRYCIPKSRHMSKAIADEVESRSIEHFISLLARNLVYQGMEICNGLEDREKSLQRALDSSQIVMDFLLGLICVFCGQNMERFLQKYLESLRAFEIIPGKAASTDEAFHTSKCSRLLRLAAVETLSVLPSFLALNLPMKYSTDTNRVQKTNWLSQYVENIQGTLSGIDQVTYNSSSLPNSGWLANIVIKECFLVCTSSYDCIFDESVSLAANASKKSAIRKNRVAVRSRDLVACHTCAIHSITIVYELVVRRHLLDGRFQTESAQRRIAGLFANTMLLESCDRVKWLSKLDASNQVRTTWLLCIICILQEAPEPLIIEFIRKSCDPKDFRLLEFIQLLHLCTTTFRNFLNNVRCSSPTIEVDNAHSVWFHQETFNTICATIIVVVDVVVEKLADSGQEKSKVMHVIIELLLQIMTIPQSPVTHLRAVGAAILVLEGDIGLFLNIVDINLEQWLRTVLVSMNSQSLSVRSIAVDFVVSLLSGIYKLHGSIHDFTLIFATILPGVIAREIAMYCLHGLIVTMDDVARSVWPMRRALADIGDTNPLDDDRVDSDLSAILSPFSRACQAIIDGVLIEMRLLGEHLRPFGVSIIIESSSRTAFDADEESLFEAASFFSPETSPLQRMRWLLTLHTLHTTRRSWVEASECLFHVSKTILDSLQFLTNVWRPSRFASWATKEAPLWHTKVDEKGHSSNINDEVIRFSDYFLEPSTFLGIRLKSSVSIKDMCDIMIHIIHISIENCSKEPGFEHHYQERFQSLLQSLSVALEHVHNQPLTPKVSARMRQAEDEAALHKVSALIQEEMKKLSDRLFVNIEQRTSTPSYVIVRVHGKKSPRFIESTTIPTFLEWDKWCVCRIPNNENNSIPISATSILSFQEFTRKYTEALHDSCVDESTVVLRTSSLDNEKIDNEVTYIDILPVNMVHDHEELTNATTPSSKQRFIYHDLTHDTATATTSTTRYIEIIVANEFPCALSRQRALDDC